MKQSMATKTKMITMGLFTLCTIGLSNATFAGIKSDSPTEFKFIGNVNNNPVFELNLNNSDADSYYISVKDESNNVLYSEKVKGVNLSRKYQLDIDESDLNAPGFEVSVEVTSAKTHKTQVYKVSTTTTVNSSFVVATL
ncbi:MAG: hypothetical protein M3139_13715 [Bacteroidota bacterium]|nr:hypothetical protein [Bacteroidota bacterium]